MDISIDFETYSKAKLVGTGSVGAWNYASHPSTHVICMAYSIDGATPELWTRASKEPLPEWMYAPEDHDVNYTAWNAMFEYAVIRNCLKLPTGPIENWWDTMALARKVALPGKLETCALAMKLSADKQKDKRGKDLIRKLCGPYYGKDHYDKPDREELLDELYAYCKQDVVTEQAIGIRLPPMSMDERKVWIIDQKINYAGIPIDTTSAGQAVEMYDKVKAKLDLRLRKLTGIDNPNSTQQMAAWLAEQGVHLPNMKAETISAALKSSELEKLGRSFTD